MLLPESLHLHDKSKYEFHYIYFLPWKDQMVQPIVDAGGKVTCFNARNNLQMLLKNKEVIKYCKKYRIELIHCHLPWSGFLGRWIFRKIKIPLIYTEHNIQEHYHPATKYVNKFTFNSQSLAVGVSADVTRSINENIAPDIPVVTILNGVNTTRFKRNKEAGDRIRKELGIPMTAPVLGNIAVFREQKLLLDWVRAFKEISKSHEDVYGILVGAGPEEENVRDLILEFDLSEKIKLPGLQTNTVGYFSAMDIFMMSSAFEGLPIALLESMSMECAVVSTKAGGAVEVIEDEKSGLLCEVGDFKTLGRLAVEILENDQKKKQLQLNARDRVKNSFSLEAMVNSLEQTYEKFLPNES